MNRSFRQTGQSLPLVLVFLVVLCIGLLVTFNTGQVLNRKIELTNTADAAAYSVAAEQARAWNMAAYMNRGRVANEVAIAQVISLNSWMTQINVTMQNFEDFVKLISWFPPLAFLKGVAQAINAVETGFRTFRNDVFRPVISEPAITILDGANTAYAGFAELMVEWAGAANAIDTARDVVKDNSPEAKVTADALVGLGLTLAGSTKTYLKSHDVPGGKGRRTTGGDRYRNVVMHSRDDFSRDRKDDWLVIDANGGTDLVDYDRWAAADVTEVDFSFGFDALKFPLGWGGAQAVNAENRKYFPGIKASTGNKQGWDNPYENKFKKAYNGVKGNSISGKFIDASGEFNSWDRVGGKKKDNYFKGYKNGIAHDYHDLKQGKGETPAIGDDAGPIHTVEVEMDIKQARTSSEIGIGGGRQALKDGARDNKMKAMASAQVYFARPYAFGADAGPAWFKRKIWGKDDRSFEKGSLFSPYWQARLVETPPLTKAALAGF